MNHTDFLDKELNVGDYVVIIDTYIGSGKFVLGKVIKLTPKKVDVQTYRQGKTSGPTLKDPKKVLKISEQDFAMKMLLAK